MPDLSTLALFTTAASALCYIIAIIRISSSIHAASQLASQDQPSAANLPGRPPWGILGAILHFTTIGLMTMEYQGLSSSFFDALSITAFIVVTMSLIAQSHYVLRALLIPVFAIATICLALASLFAHHTTIVATSTGMLMHILSSIIAYSLLSLATLQALALQQMERGLKNHSDNRWLNQLPPLQTMESLLFQLITLGWLALTVAIASGSIYIDDLFAQHLAHKTLFAVISWLLFGLLLIGRQKYGWRGATAVKWTLSAFIALALAYFGSKFVLEVLLNKA